MHLRERPEIRSVTVCIAHKDGLRSPTIRILLQADALSYATRKRGQLTSPRTKKTTVLYYKGKPTFGQILQTLADWAGRL
jgi:hypothetical protein